MEPRLLTKPIEWQGTSMGPSSKSSWKTQISRRLPKSSLTGKHNWDKGKSTEEAKVCFYFLASISVPTKHLSTVREQEAIMLYAILKGYKLNVGTIIENFIMRYHEGNKRGLIPHPATITVLCLKAGVKGVWEAEEEVPLTSQLILTGVSD